MPLLGWVGWGEVKINFFFQLILTAYKEMKKNADNFFPTLSLWRQYGDSMRSLSRITYLHTGYGIDSY